MGKSHRSLRKEALLWRQARMAFFSRIRRLFLPAFPVDFDHADFKRAEQLTRNYDRPSQPVGTTESGAGRPRIAIVKADDLRCSNFGSFIELLRIMSARKLPVTFGLICDEIPLLNRHQVSFLSSLDKKVIEIWHHGYDHKREIKWYRPFSSRWYEFQGTPEARQREHLHKGMDLARDLLSLPFSTFGPPSERMDTATENVLAELDAIKVIFNRTTCCSKLTLLVTHRIEEVVGKMGTYAQSLEKFALPEDPHAPIVIQIHPGYWDEEDFEVFAKVMDHLAGDLNYEFMTAQGYYEYDLTCPPN